MKGTRHLASIEPKLRRSGAILPLPHVPSLRHIQEYHYNKYRRYNLQSETNLRSGEVNSMLASQLRHVCLIQISVTLLILQW